ncbi:MAG: flagellar hook-basal body protein [Epsilonproteobacteria bacterium]|nr:flagellar hook-basal body protein [Campylobacterota bacterium]
MQNGYYQVTGAMIAQFNKLDVTTNNLANVNTSGFRKDSVIIGDFERIYQEQRDILPLDNHTKEASKFVNRSLNRTPRVVEGHTDFSAPNLKQTGNQLDFGLTGGDLFFAVETPQGVRLTQQSSFVLDNEGNITTKEGYKLLADNFKESDQRGINLSNNKTVALDESGRLFADGEEVAKLFIGRANNLKNIEKEGDNLYTSSNLDNDIRPMSDGTLVQQGFKQMSNVNAVKEMVNLIEGNRLVQMYQKVMTSHMDELNREAITKLASVKA